MTVTIHEAIPTMFHNVQVIAIPSTDPVTGGTNYDVTFIPVAVEVSSPDAVINYQLIWPTPADVVFIDMSVLPVDQNQFSEESRSVDGKLLTFSDANTSDEILHVTLNFTDASGVSFTFDPQIVNRPS
jgi:hypothetical protein